MTRTTLVNQVLDYTDVLKLIEPDVLNICQSHWSAYNEFWDSLQKDNRVILESKLTKGPWTNMQLKELVEQIELIIVMMNQ